MNIIIQNLFTHENLKIGLSQKNKTSTYILGVKATYSTSFGVPEG